MRIIISSYAPYHEQNHLFCKLSAHPANRVSYHLVSTPEQHLLVPLIFEYVHYSRPTVAKQAVDRITILRSIYPAYFDDGGHIGEDSEHNLPFLCKLPRRLSASPIIDTTSIHSPA